MPNVILESRGNQIVFDQFSQNDYLTYTIRFQNTSPLNARNLKIVDLIDPRIDELSIRVIDASHFYSLERIGSELNFRFDNIFLVPSSQSVDLSKGYIAFKVKLKPGLVSGTIIPNSAKMYFDSNPVVNSNTFNTQFTANLANAIFDASNFMIFPNPAYNLIQINLQKTDEVIESIQINDILGKSVFKISNISSKQHSLDVSNLSKGVYFVEITTESKLKQTKKLLLE